MNKLARIAVGLIIPVCLSGFLLLNYAAGDTTPAPATNKDILAKKAIDTWNRHAVDTAVSLLRSGDLALRLGEGADSYMLAQMNRKNKSFSHCGLVMVENGYPFVYHSIGGEDNPDQRLRRDSANFFFTPQHNMSIAIVRYDLAVDKINELEHVVAAYYKQRPKFDMKFDISTDDKLYCAEFIYKALNKAAHDTGYIRTSLLLGHSVVSIDDLFINPHAGFVWQTGLK
jgi:Permuted papain-like amidase enzyme, YaeF/YiiX, C92 family